MSKGEEEKLELKEARSTLVSTTDILLEIRVNGQTDSISD